MAMLEIVSITPLAVERDSRTFKQAASVARLGYRSVVLEGDTSHLDARDLPFELKSLRGGSAGQETERPRDHPLAAVGRWMASLPFRLPGAWYAFAHVYRYGLRTFLHTPKAALYYLHAFNQFPAIYLRSRIHGAPYVYDAHDFYPGIEEGGSLGWMHRCLRLPWERWLERQCVRRAAVVVTVSDGIAELQRRTFGRQPVVIRNCEDRRLRKIPARPLREVVGLGPAEFLLVVVGNAKKGQAVHQMLEAIQTVPSHVHVALVGRGYEQFVPRIHGLGLEARVHLIGPVTSIEVVPFIESADASMLLYYPRSANYRYCLPNGFFQAIAAGLPLLYPTLPELEPIAEEHRLGVPIDPLLPKSIAAGIMILVQDPAQVSAFRRNAARARQLLSWEREEEILADLLKHALKAAPTGKG